MLKSCKDLYYEHNLPITSIAKRLKIKYVRVKKIIKDDISDPQLAFRPYAER